MTVFIYGLVTAGVIGKVETSLLILSRTSSCEPMYQGIHIPAKRKFATNLEMGFNPATNSVSKTHVNISDSDKLSTLSDRKGQIAGRPDTEK